MIFTAQRLPHHQARFFPLQIVKECSGQKPGRFSSGESSLPFQKTIQRRKFLACGYFGTLPARFRHAS
jgi:hypothetical protein